MAAKTNTAAAAVATVIDRIDTLRSWSAAARERREQILNAPRDFAEAITDVDELVAKAATRGKPNVGHIASRNSGFVDLLHDFRNVGQSSDPTDARPFDLIAAMMPATVGDWLKAELTEYYRGLDEKPLTAKERVAQLAEVEREIAKQEREEIALLWQLEDAGLSALWRGDLNPALVFGLTN